MDDDRALDRVPNGLRPIAFSQVTGPAQQWVLSNAGGARSSQHLIIPTGKDGVVRGYDPTSPVRVSFDPGVELDSDSARIG